MRHQGTIASWDLGRGIGAIQWHGGDERVFVRITDFPEGIRRPEIGNIVTYYRGEDDRGRPIASMVEYVHPAGHVASPATAPARNLHDRTDAPVPSFARNLPARVSTTRLPTITLLLVLGLVVVAVWAAWNWF